MSEEIKGPYRFTVCPRPVEIGGGWRFRAYETMPGGEEVEIAGGIFPAEDNPSQPGPTPAGANGPAHAQALAAAHEWLASMPRPEHRDGEHYMLGCFARDAAARLGD
jgi:hypothetical protein